MSCKRIYKIEQDYFDGKKTQEEAINLLEEFTCYSDRSLRVRETTPYLGRAALFAIRHVQGAWSRCYKHNVQLTKEDWLEMTKTYNQVFKTA